MTQCSVARSLTHSLALPCTLTQDFFAAFGLGGDSRRIATVDADGVAMAALHGLAAAHAAVAADLAALARRADALEADVRAAAAAEAEAEAALAEQEDLLARLEARLAARSKTASQPLAAAVAS
jgi:hypothetical protein